MAENNESSRQRFTPETVSLSPPDELEQWRIFLKVLNRRIIQVRITQTIASLKKKFESPESLRTLADFLNENKIRSELTDIYFSLHCHSPLPQQQQQQPAVNWLEQHIAKAPDAVLATIDNKLKTLQKDLLTRNNFLTGAQQQPLDNEKYAFYALSGNEEYVKNMLLEAEMHGVMSFLVHKN